VEQLDRDSDGFFSSASAGRFQMEWLKLAQTGEYVCSLDGDLLMRVVDCSNRGDKVVLVFIQNIFTCCQY
jgi:hypothetical protein